MINDEIDTPIGRQIFRENGVTLCVGISELYSPRLVPLFAQAGADYVFIDMEHSSFSMREVAGIIDGAHGARVPIVVRPPAVERGYLGRLLDLGADGIFAPRISSAADAGTAVRFMKYPPVGERGDSGKIFGTRPRSAQAAKAANENTVLVALVETREGAENIDEICETSGVDAISIGHADLSLSLGVPGDRESRTYQEAEERIVDSCRRHNMPFTIGVAPTIEQALQQKERGCFSLFVDDEIGLITSALSSYVQEFRRQATEHG